MTTAKDLIDKKHKAEDDINSILDDFVLETGLRVTAMQAEDEVIEDSDGKFNNQTFKITLSIQL